TRAFETHHARRRPGNRVALSVRDGDHRIVERCVDVCHARRDVLFLAAAHFAALLLFRHLVLSLRSRARRSYAMRSLRHKKTPDKAWPKGRVRHLKARYFFLPAIGL